MRGTAPQRGGTAGTTDTLAREDLASLARDRGGRHVSIYLPTHAAAPDNHGDHSAFRGLVREAEDTLHALEVRGSQAAALLAPARALLEDGMFWRPQPGGVAVFLKEGEMRVVRFPHHVAPHVSVDGRFHMKPLLVNLGACGPFHVLGLTQHSVRLWRGTSTRLTPVPMGNLPTSLDQVLRNDGRDEQIRSHTGGTGRTTSPGRRAAVFHGGGTETGITTRYLVEYCQRVAAGVRDLIAGEEGPLVLAATEPLAGLYRGMDASRRLAESMIEGNPEGMTPAELYRRACAAVAPEFDRVVNAAVRRYHDLSATTQASAAPLEVVAAAAYGRVEVIFVSPGLPIWGSFDPVSGSAEVHPRHMLGDDDLADHAAVDTFLGGGAVHPGPIEGAPLAAVFRY